MIALKEKYKEILQTYLDYGNEETLYKANELSKEFVLQAIAPEEVVALHYEVVQELAAGLPPQATLTIINRCLAYLLEVMVTYGVNYSRVWPGDDDSSHWQEAVLRLSSSLKLFENRHKLILHTIPVGIITINKGGIVSFANNHLDFLGLTAEQLIGNTLIDVIDQDNVLKDNSFTTLLFETLETGKIYSNVELQYNKELVLQISTCPIRKNDGEISEATVFIQDITGRKQLEKTIINNEKLAAVGTLAAGIAGEIRNPLTSVRGFIQLLEPELKESKKKHFVKIILEEIDRANGVINDFLSFARPSSPRTQKVDLLSLIEEIRIITESEAILREVNLDFSYPAVHPCVHIDKDQIKQVLLNIVKNAFDAVKEKGWVKVNVQLNDNSEDVLIIIEDNGLGMDQQTVARIFDPFFTTKDSGTGLGLAVSYQIIKNHGGQITVSSQPGFGTTFIISLPHIQ